MFYILSTNKTPAEKLKSAALHKEYTRFVLHQVKEFTAARYDTIRLSRTHSTAYAQAVGEFLSEIPSDFSSTADLLVGKAPSSTVQARQEGSSPVRLGWCF